MSKIVKKKIINDPVYGFISLNDELIIRLVDHPYFQRLRNISQLGLTHLVYPGAHHSRFQHALGALHLMQKAIATLRSKGVSISEAESEAASAAILLHDVGHGPFSHALEHSIVEGTDHEEISRLVMNRLNEEFDGALDLCIRIFNNEYNKPFLHQLVSSQLDVDRLDYLKRDSFFSGVSEGVIGTDRIISMLNVRDGKLVVEEKGIYSIEKFIVARRLMYWQVYLHKTVISAEFVLLKVLKRAKELTKAGTKLPAARAVEKLLASANDTGDDFLGTFLELDDNDVLTSIKEWKNHDDLVLRYLSRALVDRQLLKVHVQKEPFDVSTLSKFEKEAQKRFEVGPEESKYFAFEVGIGNMAYTPESERIEILMKDGSVKEISEVADILTYPVLSEPVRKYFLCFASELRGIFDRS